VGAISSAGLTVRRTPRKFDLLFPYPFGQKRDPKQ